MAKVRSKEENNANGKQSGVYTKECSSKAKFRILGNIILVVSLVIQWSSFSRE